VIHHPQNEDLAVPVVYPGDHPEAVSADVEHDAVSDLIGRSKRLLHLGEALPLVTQRKFVPCG
jgi:hypothetical protein